MTVDDKARRLPMQQSRLSSLEQPWLHEAVQKPDQHYCRQRLFYSRDNRFKLNNSYKLNNVTVRLFNGRESDGAMLADGCQDACRQIPVLVNFFRILDSI